MFSFQLTITLVVVLSVTLYNFFIYFFLNKKEGKAARFPVSQIIKGAEPVLLKGNRDTACLLIHGFIGTPTDFGRLPKLLHERGYTVSVPLLPGHGTFARDLAKVKATDLIAFTKQHYLNLKKEYKNVVLIGLSMGGSLSAIVAAEAKADYLILLAPYFKVKHMRFYLLPTEWWNELFSPFIPFIFRLPYFKQVNNRSAIPFIIDYDFVPTKAARTSFEIARMARKTHSSITAKTLLIHSKADRATDCRAALQFANKLDRNKTSIVLLEKSNHLILWDFESAQVEEVIHRFVSEIQ